jgi:hypothetical protein
VILLYTTGSVAAVVVALLVLIPLGLVVTRVADGVGPANERREDGNSLQDRLPGEGRLPGSATGRDRGRGSRAAGLDPSPGREPDRRVRDGLARLRDRYAAGELDEDQFERKLETLLETETPEGARSYLDRTSDGRTDGATDDTDRDDTATDDTDRDDTATDDTDRDDTATDDTDRDDTATDDTDRDDTATDDGTRDPDADPSLDWDADS